MIYARYSSHMQNDASIEQQVAKCTIYAEQLGVKVVGVYADRAMTGKNDNRPEFQRMLKDAEKQMFNVVIAWKSNRMGRNMVDALVNDGKLLDCGVATKYVEEDFDDSAAGRFALRSMMNLNQFYSENMAEDIRRGLEDAARKGGALGRMPLGYRRDPKTGKYVIVPEEAEIVREIFRMFDEGFTLAYIIDTLNARGVRTISGVKFNKNSFHAMLVNRKYVGEYDWADIHIEGGIPAIIEPDLFERVQKRMADRSEILGRRKSDVDYILTGKIFCGHCGQQMSGYSGRGHCGKMYYYYRCKGRKEGNCKKKHEPKQDIENIVAHDLREKILTNECLNWIADLMLEAQDRLRNQSMLAQYQRRLEEVRSSMVNIMSAVMKGFHNAHVNEQMIDLENEEQELLTLIKAEETVQPLVDRETLLFYFDQFRKGDIDNPITQKELFRTFLEKVYVFDDKLRITYNFEELMGSKNSDFEGWTKESFEPLNRAGTNYSIWIEWPILVLEHVLV